MAITQVGTATTNSSASTTALSINKPTGAAVGHILIAGIASDSTVPTPPSDWTAFGQQSNASFNVNLYWKRITGTEPTFYTWTVGNVGPSAGYITAWAGVDPGNPVNPIAAIQAPAFTTGAAEPDTTPDVTTTAVAGRTLYVRGVRRGSAGGAAVTAVLTGTGRLATVGGTSGTANTSYSIGLFADAADFTASGTKTGLAISCDQPEDTNYLATFVLKAAPAGTAAVQLPKLGVSLAGRHRIDATVAATLPKLAVSWEGTAAPPSGHLETVLPKPTVSVAADSTGGAFAAGLPMPSATLGGSVNPIGAFTATLPMVQPDLLLETRPFGLHVILVEPEKRALRITDLTTTPIFKSQVAFEVQESALTVQLPLLRSEIYAHSYSAMFDFDLPLLKADIRAETNAASFNVQLPQLNTEFQAQTVNGDLTFNLPLLTASLEGVREFAGSFEVGLWLPTVELASAAILGSVDVDLPSLTDVQFGAHFGNQEGDLAVELPLLTADFEAEAIQEDLLKYAVNIGNGSNTSFTVTHSFGSRDVVVCVYDNTTYEEVMPLTTHATTNTVTVAFAAAPATDAYRVVVLYSST